MSTSIGKVIIKLREESKYTQVQLGEGLCVISQLNKIETDMMVPDYFLLDRLFERLGKGAERLEYVLPRFIYKIYELQYRIQTAILHQNFIEAEKLLQEYEGHPRAGQPLHRQFIQKERAQIAWIRGEKPEEVLEYLDEAIAETMPEISKIDLKKALSVEELKLLLFRWEVSCGTRYERNLQEVIDILEYMEQRVYAPEELVKAYPYAVLLLNEHLEKRSTDEWEYLRSITWKALELLRNEAKISFLPEILECYAELLMPCKEKEKEILELGQMRQTLVELEEEFGVHFEKYRLFQHMNRSFELDYVLIRNNRQARKLSQEALCEDICTQVTLSRIETGKNAPSDKHVKMLLGKMKRERERIGMNVVADTYEMIALEAELVRAIHKSDFESSECILKEMQEQLDMSDIINQQYIKAEQLRIKLRQGKYSCQEGVDELYKILYMTLPKSNEEFTPYSLTDTECNILNQIAIQYCRNNQKEKGIALWRKMLQNYEEKGMNIVFNIRNWELITGNMAGRMEELDYYQEPIQICMERFETELVLGNGKGIGRSLAIIACVLERKHDIKCIARFRQTLVLYKLMKFKYRYCCIKEYMEEKGIDLKNI